MHRELEWPMSKATCLYAHLYMVYKHLYKIIEGSRGTRDPDPKRRIWRGSVTISKNKWHIHDANNTAGLVHKGERGFHMHILCSIAPRLVKVIGVLPVLAVYVAAYPD